MGQVHRVKNRVQQTIRMVKQRNLTKKQRLCCLIRELLMWIMHRQQNRQLLRNSSLHQIRRRQQLRLNRQRTQLQKESDKQHPAQTAIRMTMPQQKRPHMMWLLKNRHRKAELFMYGQTEALKKQWFTATEAILRASRMAILLIWKSLPKTAIPLRRLQLMAVR